jgi:hypothetical protein
MKISENRSIEVRDGNLVLFQGSDYIGKVGVADVGTILSSIGDSLIGTAIRVKNSAQKLAALTFFTGALDAPWDRYYDSILNGDKADMYFPLIGMPRDGRLSAYAPNCSSFEKIVDFEEFFRNKANKFEIGGYTIQKDTNDIRVGCQSFTKKDIAIARRLIKK